MSRFTNKDQDPGHRWGRGALRELRRRRRAEAEERNAQTPHERTRRHRLGRCDCK
jgi:hypothetical protein